MANADSEARKKDGNSPGRALIRLTIPAAYAALLLKGVFQGADGGGNATIVAIAALAVFAAYLAWRFYSMLSSRSDEREGKGLGGLAGIEMGFLALLVLATLPQFLPVLTPWWAAVHGVLVVGLAFAVRLPEVLIFPLCAVLLGAATGDGWNEQWLIALAQLEALALVAGGLFSMNRAKILRLHKAMQRVKLEAEHLQARADPSADGGTPKGDLTCLNETLYAYLVEVKKNADAYSAVLAVRSTQGHLYVRELVSDSHNVLEEAGLDLTGNAFRWILKNKKPLRIARLSDAATALGYYAGNVAVKSFVGVPVMSGEEVEGVLAVDSLKEHAFPDDKLTILNVASHQVMTLLSQIRQLEQVKREARDFKCLHEFSKQVGSCQTEDDLLALALHVVDQRLQPDFSVVVLVNEAGEASIERVGNAKWDELKGQTFTPAEGLVGWALDSGQYLFYDHERPSARRPVFAEKVKCPDFPTLLIHPFSGQEERLGALVIGISASMALDSGAIAFCDILCHQFSLGILQIRAMEKLRDMASVDVLTGLKNRRFFFDAAHEELKRARRYEQPLSVLLFDVDHFKKINDVFGHPAGDEVLRRVGELLGGHAREIDVVARYGGEEFVMLLPNTDEEGAYVVAERVRKVFASLQVMWEKRPILVRVSGGAATLEDSGETMERLLERVDQALYSAKETGRNKVVKYSDIKEYMSWK
jgi:diguanylate cyclase (GGDEF)-like protein